MAALDGWDEMQMNFRGKRIGLTAALAALLAVPVQAQVQTIDPNAAYDTQAQLPTTSSADPVATPVGSEAGAIGAPGADPATYPEAQPSLDTGAAVNPAAGAAGPGASVDPAAPAATTADGSQTYHEDDLIGAAEGVFGKGAHGLAMMIKDLLKKQGEPNGYIVGREGGGAFVVGLRYGSGTLFHKVEGQKPVYWTGPSVGFDVGANAGSTFVLVYNLYDSEELYKRFPAAEGQAYLVGGFNASYMRKGDVVLIPIRMGAGLRLGVNAGYMKFSHSQKWMPF